ncbi:lipid transfer protein [Thermoplasma volcanium GSS1]|uniref:propanoyl-CoA C-acyltransferase n=1 Tax=Thermoplasma volcanium (strain ATCC 51530 / DSM 4299 / JCM 9571 / NBRC 15438 / GSS1) TaxID=273116 RepID=Q97CN3_THEVO|nr:thiolase domain-containing protein [Thermoplasma volcanium]BAB59210.1 lipid transfer protein [Thermoplasma volcanium GSS1]
MVRVGIIGYGISKFGKRNDASMYDLIWEAGSEALKTSGVDKKDVEYLVVSNMGMWSSEELPAVVAGEVLGTERAGTNRVEAACASGSSAISSAYDAIASGHVRMAMALGVEKMSEVDTGTAIELIGRAGNFLWEYEFFGLTFPGYYALHATAYLDKYGGKEEDLALVSVKNHHYAHFNPKAQFTNDISVEDVMSSRYIASPLKLYDSSPITDGAAAVVLASEDVAKQYTDTPVWIDAIGSNLGTSNLSKRPDFTGIEAAREAARKAYKVAGIDSEKPYNFIDGADVHDCFSIAELMAYEDLGFAGKGEALELIREGQTYIGGRIPVNVDGGLISKGHPIGATGVAMAVEATKQLLRKAENGRQIDVNKGRFLTHNVGGTGHYAFVTVYSI